MILITQGHEKGIGLEVFLKSFLLLTSKQKKVFKLFTDRETLTDNLKLLGIDYSLEDNQLNLSSGNLTLELFDKKKFTTPASTVSMLKALEALDEHRDILITLPTSKDQIYLEGKQVLGHTEFFRSLYKTDHLGMSFVSPEENILLLTDHLPLKDVPKAIDPDLIYFKVAFSILGFEQYLFPLKEVIFAGLNPHAGENGALGNEEEIIVKAIERLKKTFKRVNFKGPFSGDALHFKKNKDISQLFVYSYHDQGLAPFKSQYGPMGINLTFGLPFLRMSVDHGTAFDLYGKNAANYMGQYFLLNQALKAHTNLKSQKAYYGIRSHQNYQGPRPQP